jgi:hypothetical protein
MNQSGTNTGSGFYPVKKSVFACIYTMLASHKVSAFHFTADNQSRCGWLPQGRLWVDDGNGLHRYLQRVAAHYTCNCNIFSTYGEFWKRSNLVWTREQSDYSIHHVITNWELANWWDHHLPTSWGPGRMQFHLCLSATPLAKAYQPLRHQKPLAIAVDVTRRSRHHAKASHTQRRLLFSLQMHPKNPKKKGCRKWKEA